MYFMSLYMDSCERSCRAEVFTCSATDTSLLIYGRNHQRLRVVRILSYHLDRTGRAVAGTVAAADSVGVHYAVVEIDNGMTDLD